MSVAIKVYECPCLSLLPVIHIGIVIFLILITIDSVGLDVLVPKM